MITEENWVNFIRTFFGADVTDEWVHHVASGWNYMKNEPGCNCKFTWYDGTVECEIYTGVKEAKAQFERENTVTITTINVEGVEGFINRGNDDEYFFKEDEPLKDIVDTWKDEENGTTGRSLSADDYMNALKSTDDTQTLPPYAEVDVNEKDIDDTIR